MASFEPISTASPGALIRAARAAKGISAAGLARTLGVSAAAVSNWENGRALPRAAFAVRLARELDIRSGELRADPVIHNAQACASNSDEMPLSLGATTEVEAPPADNRPDGTERSAAQILEAAREELARTMGVRSDQIKLELHVLLG